MLERIKSMKNAMVLAVLGVFASISAFAEGETTTVSVSDLWSALGINFSTQMTQVFTALQTPVGVVVTVVFVMAIFWFCLRMAKSAINKRNSI